MNIKPDRITDTEIVISCPQCKQVHSFEKYDFDKWIMNNDEDDWFTISQSILRPEFVCRNVKCNFSEVLKLLGVKNG